MDSIIEHLESDNSKRNSITLESHVSNNDPTVNNTPNIESTNDINLKPINFKDIKKGSELSKPRVNEEYFESILKNYKNIKSNLENINEDIEKLEKVHFNFVNNAENKLRFHEYGVYIDDIYYQIKLLKMEYTNQMNIQMHNINKMYKDLYRLYYKVVKKLISIHIENSNLTPLIDKKHVNDKIVNEKKQYFSKIKIFNEISNDNYSIEDCECIYIELESRLDELVRTVDNINNIINNVKEKFSEGLLLQTYLISLKGEKDKIIIEYNMFHKILKSTLLSHLDISTKYFNRTSVISKEIVNDTEKINLIEKV
jgi:hypothetical protein